MEKDIIAVANHNTTPVTSLEEQLSRGVGPDLTSCQEQAREMLESGENVFLTGAAGSGKSFLIRKFLTGQTRGVCPVLASTGAAAILLGGRTFHSFFGLGIMEGRPENVIERALKDRRVIKRLKECEGFILDEISMIPGAAFAVADRISKRVRGNGLPWGGLRVIVVGDFYQLPPVARGGNRPDWVFNNRSWLESNFLRADLKTVVRTQDPEFLAVLNEIRRGRVTPSVRTLLDARMGSLEDLEHNEMTFLFPRRQQMDAFNAKKLAGLEGEELVYPTLYFGDARAIETLKVQAPVSEVLVLKYGAFVMIRQNDPRNRWVNGSTGYVRRVDEDTLTIELLSGREVELGTSSFAVHNAEGVATATATNFPVNLAYASTIHKAQGATLDRTFIDLSALWEHGQAYVALSRVRKASDFSLSGWSEKSIRVDSAVELFLGEQVEG